MIKKDPSGYWKMVGILVRKYSDDQPRDDDGKFASGGGGSSEEKPGESKPSSDNISSTVFSRTPKQASELYGKVPKENGKPVPVTTKVGYHVTKRENAEKILKEGFKLDNVKPRWQNDYAVSVSMGSAKSAAAYFAKRGEKLDTEKYAVLKVTFKGRMAGDYTSTPSYASNAQDYNRRMQKEGYDAHVMKGQAYIYNTGSIGRIEEIRV